MAEKALIVLQENSGEIPFPIELDRSTRKAAEGIIDLVTETFEDIKTTLQAAGRYQKVYLLTDSKCTREQLLDALVAEARINRIVDLLVLGHGGEDILMLNNKKFLTGKSRGNIRSLLPDAKARGVNSLSNLRMVFMCNCFGGTLNDDWLAIGAKVSMGALDLNYMPEPMVTFFMHNWVNGQKAKDAAKNAYEGSIPLWVSIYQPTVRIRQRKTNVPYPCPTWDNPLKICTQVIEMPDGVVVSENRKITGSKLAVGGNGNLRFN